MDNNNLIRKLDEKPATEITNGFSYPKFFTFVALAVILGIGVGFFLNKSNESFKESMSGVSNTEAEKTIGIADKSTFKDKAEGVLREGGVDGEGNFHLERPGGTSQNVYLTSSTVDLSKHIGKKVRVWGETFTAEKAGWLMDVGYVEILK